MNDVIYSPLQQADINETAIVIVEAFSKNGEPHPRYTPEKVTDTLLRSIGSNSVTSFIVAKVNDKVVGVGGYGQAQFASNTWFLFMLAVDERFRRYGIGSRITEQRIEQILSLTSKGRILVSTFHPHRFERLGFVGVDKDTESTATLMVRKI